MPTDNERQTYSALLKGNFDEFLRLVGQHPETLRSHIVGQTLLHHAAKLANAGVVGSLLDAGADVNAPVSFAGMNYNALFPALNRGSLATVRLLLEHGADPNQGRNLIAAMGRKEDALDAVKLLVKYGVDVSRDYRFDGEEGPVFNALSWAIDADKTEIVEYLLSKGAVMPPGSSG